jgi:hypothetical protein
MLAYGFAVAMSRDRPVAVTRDVGDDLTGYVVARGADEKTAKELNGSRAVLREGKQFSTVWADVRLRSGEVVRVWVNDVDALVVRGKEADSGAEDDGGGARDGGAGSADAAAA